MGDLTLSDIRAYIISFYRSSCQCNSASYSLPSSFNSVKKKTLAVSLVRLVSIKRPPSTHPMIASLLIFSFLKRIIQHFSYILRFVCYCYAGIRRESNSKHGLVNALFPVIPSLLLKQEFLQKLRQVHYLVCFSGRGKACSKYKFLIVKFNEVFPDIYTIFALLLLLRQEIQSNAMLPHLQF